jgi:uncharacterized protein (DUF58 family)
VREALAGLTARGRALTAAGAAAAVSALVLGESDLLRVAVLLALLPVLSVVAVSVTRYRLSCGRSLEPDRIQAGTAARMVLRLQNISRLPTGTMLLEDDTPQALGHRPRFVLGRLWPAQVAAVTYTVRAEVRGRYRLGPLTVRLTDLFGLCETSRAFASSSVLTVTPVVEPLPHGVWGTGQATGTGEGRPGSVAVHGVDDVATREYRNGDDLRKVHWRSTARVGELMVRREEQPQQNRAVVLLDTRAAAHRGTGPDSSLEWAVSAAASIALHLSHGGYVLRLVTDTGVDLDATGAASEGALLDHLADVRASRRAGLEVPAEILRRTDRGLVVAVLGLVDPAEVPQLAAVRAAGTTCVAILLDVSEWTDAAQRPRTAAATRATAAALTHAGWHVVTAGRGSHVADLWARSPAGARP